MIFFIKKLYLKVNRPFSLIDSHQKMNTYSHSTALKNSLIMCESNQKFQDISEKTSNFRTHNHILLSRLS